jgi:hypothetical protein
MIASTMTWLTRTRSRAAATFRRTSISGAILNEVMVRVSDAFAGFSATVGSVCGSAGVGSGAF